jgi:hypothetical protein
MPPWRQLLNFFFLQILFEHFFALKPFVFVRLCKNS